MGPRWKQEKLLGRPSVDILEEFTERRKTRYTVGTDIQDIRSKVCPKLSASILKGNLRKHYKDLQQMSKGRS